MSSTVITKAGIYAAAMAGMYGPQINITKVRIGSNIITPDSSMTDVSGFVWEGDTSYIRYQVLNESTVLFKVTLSEDVGDFDIGNIALILDSGEAFAIVGLPAVSVKIKNQLPDVVGNRRIFNIPIVLSGIANITNLSILIADEASIPVVANETLLPDPLVAPYSAYSVLMHSTFGTPVIALRVDSNWWFIPSQLSEGSGYQFAASNFDTVDPPQVGDAIRLDIEAKLFKKANSDDLQNGYLGFRGKNNTVITSGRYTDPNYNEQYPSYIVGTKYYADGSDNMGKLTVVPTAWYVGIAVSPSTLLLEEQNINLATTDYPGNIQIATIEEVQAGSNNSKACTPYSIARGLNVPSPNEFSNGQFYNTNTSIPSWQLFSAGTSTYNFAKVPHQRQDWVEGPNYYLRFSHVVADAESVIYSNINQSINTSSKYQNTTKTISFRARSSTIGQKVLVSANVNFGTGGVPSQNLQLTSTYVTLTDSWQEYSVTFTIPQLTGVYTFGTDNNDTIEYSIGISPNNTNYFDLDWIKLETGSYSTGINSSTPEYCLQGSQQYVYGNWTFDNTNINSLNCSNLVSSNSTLNTSTSILDSLIVDAVSVFNNTVTFNGNVKITGVLTCDQTIEGTARKAYYADATGE